MMKHFVFQAVCVIVGLAAVIVSVLLILVRSRYTKMLSWLKLDHEYQTIDLNTLVQVYKAVGKDRFDTRTYSWRDSNNKIRHSRPTWYLVSWCDKILVDIPWFPYVRFLMWKSKWDRRQAKLTDDVKRNKNSSTRALMDIQKRLENMVESDLKDMKEAALTQKEIIDRIQIVS